MIPPRARTVVAPAAAIKIFIVSEYFCNNKTRFWWITELTELLDDCSTTNRLKPANNKTINCSDKKIILSSIRKSPSQNLYNVKQSLKVLIVVFGIFSPCIFIFTNKQQNMNEILFWRQTLKEKSAVACNLGHRTSELWR